MRPIAIFIITLFFISCGVKNPTILSSKCNPMLTSLNYVLFLDIAEMTEEKKYGLVGGKPIKVGV